MDDQTYQIIGAEPEVCSTSASFGPTTHQSKRDPQEEICVI
jgi:hypothetical protein